MQVTKEIKAALKQFADRLPATHKELDPADKETQRPQTGAELLAANPNIRGPKGEAIDPKKRYFVRGYGTATNHLKRLIRAYESGGMAAVVKYLQPYESFLGTPETEAQPAPADEQPRAAEGFPEGRLEMGCGECTTCAQSSCPAQPVVKKRKARRTTVQK